ncbi:MAG: hypothetical protein JXQ93_12845 [Flavobacteriaceae bacterium]
MKQFFLSLIFTFIICFPCICQETFTLKKPDVQKIHQTLQESDYLKSAIFLYLENNYGKNSQKKIIKKDSDGITECGFSKVFQHNIEYEIEQCNEVSYEIQKITFPKTSMEAIKKWVELIYEAGFTKIKNVWYPNENKYGPKDKEAGCYFQIKQTKDTTIVNIWCGS